MNRIISVFTVLLGASAAVFADLPYSWAHVVAVSLGAAIASVHIPNAATTSTSKSNTPGDAIT